MSMLFDDDILIHRVMTPGLDGTGMTIAEYAALRTDVDALLARPVIDGLGDVPDVVLSSPQAGETLVRDENGDWVNGSVAGSVAEVRRHGNTVANTNVSLLYFRGGLTADPFEGDGVLVNLRYAGSGVDERVARSDHSHTLRANLPFRFSATGSLSSGTRTLASGGVTGLNPDNTYVISARLSGQVRGEAAGAGYSIPRITISGDMVPAPERPRTVAGVQVPFGHEHPGVVMSGVSSLSVQASISYDEGDPIWVGGGDLIVEIKANR